MIKKRDFTKSLIGAGIFFTVLNYVDIKVLNRMKIGKTMNYGKKFCIINLMNVPFYYLFYTDINNRYVDIKKHLVKKYLIIGDELMFKKRSL